MEEDKFFSREGNYEAQEPAVIIFAREENSVQGNNQSVIIGTRIGLVEF